MTNSGKFETGPKSNCETRTVGRCTHEWSRCQVETPTATFLCQPEPLEERCHINNKAASIQGLCVEPGQSCLCPIVRVALDDIYMLALRSGPMLRISKQNHLTPWRNQFLPNLYGRARTKTQKLPRQSKTERPQSIANARASASSQSLPLHWKGTTYPNSSMNGHRQSETSSLLAATPR